MHVFQGRRRRGGWGGFGRHSFSLLSATAHARIILLTVALKYVVSKEGCRAALSICSSEKRGIRRLRDREASKIDNSTAACNGGITLEQPPTKIAVSAR